jgi:hypothetical protein
MAATTARVAARELFVDAQVGLDSGNDCLDARAPCRTVTYALANARSRDEVVAAPGTYSGDERFPLVIPQGVVLRSSSGAAVTVLRDEDPDPANPRVVLMTIEGASPRIGIEGFTVDGAGLADNPYGVFVECFAPTAAQPPEPPFVRDLVVRGCSRAGIVLVTWGCCAGMPGLSTRLGATVERNRIEGGPGMSGIEVAVVLEDEFTQALDESELRNNVVVGAEVGIDVECLPGTGGMRAGGVLRTRVRHNTVLDSIGDALRLRSEGAAAGEPAVRIEASSNILAGSGGYGIREDQGDGSARYRQADVVDLLTNIVHGNAMGGYFDSDTLLAYSTAAELTAIPDLAGRAAGNLDLAPLAGADGHLEAGSPAIDAGAATITVPDDIDREPRPAGAGPDIGADELALVRRGVFLGIDPLQPEKALVFSQLAPAGALTPSPWIDPDRGVLHDLGRPLVVYQLDAPGTVIRLVKDEATSSVALSYY